MYIISIIFTKIVNKVITTFRLGSGNTWPGHLVLKLNPYIWKDIKKSLPERVAFITGTNGKTTTSKMLRHILEKQGMHVLHNETGANLLNGVVSSILLHSDLRGSLPYEAAVFELDEFTLPVLIKHIKPQVVAFLNLSRDQLDRHWELDVVLEKWQKVVRHMSHEQGLILDRTVSNLRLLAESFSGETSFFDDDLQILSGTGLKGDFNAKNANCALILAEKLGVPGPEAEKSLQDFAYAYGRGEKTLYADRNWQILLAKNPESMNQNLKLIQAENSSTDTILYILNDNIPDGLDVSWIYDIDPKQLRAASRSKKVYVSGKRALDMAIRLQYSGVDVVKENVSSNLREVVNKMIGDGHVRKILVLPNYSAMLAIRKILVGRKIL